MSQPDLASIMGNNFQNVSAYERGEVAPTLFWVNRFLEATETDKVEFMKQFFEELADQQKKVE